MWAQHVDLATAELHTRTALSAQLSTFYNNTAHIYLLTMCMHHIHQGQFFICVNLLGNKPVSDSANSYNDFHNDKWMYSHAVESSVTTCATTQRFMTKCHIPLGPFIMSAAQRYTAAHSSTQTLELTRSSSSSSSSNRQTTLDKGHAVVFWIYFVKVLLLKEVTNRCVHMVKKGRETRQRAEGTLA